MAYAHIKHGPSSWNIMLELFDEIPFSGIEQFHNRRHSEFILGHLRRHHESWCMDVRILGLDKPEVSGMYGVYPGLWRVKVVDNNTSGLPKGYYLPEEPFVVFYDPVRRRGCVDLALVSPCCRTPIIPEGDELKSGTCVKCRKCVFRIKPGTGGVRAWLDSDGQFGDEPTEPVVWLPEYVSR